MNKIISTLAGVAIVAAAGVVPAFAAPAATPGVLTSPPGAFTFLSSGLNFSATSGTDQVTFNPASGGGLTTATFTLAGTETGVGSIYYNVNPSGLTINGVAETGADGLQFTVVPNSNGSGVIINSTGAAPDGTAFNLANPVPEASTVISFGALLALGGLAILRRKSVKA